MYYSYEPTPLKHTLKLLDAYTESICQTQGSNSTLRIDRR